jgi:hypothetical protein
MVSKAAPSMHSKLTHCMMFCFQCYCNTLHMQEAILYAYDLTTVPSLLPAFANKRDLIVCDEVRGHA